MKVIKSNSYIPMDNSYFHMPLPCAFEVLDENRVICSCTVDTSHCVYVENKIAKGFNKGHSPSITDVHFFFNTRAYMPPEFFAEKQNEKFKMQMATYEIVRMTHGILPTDRIWIRFADENLTYEQALDNYHNTFSDQHKEKIENILKQHTIDINKIPHDNIGE